MGAATKFNPYSLCVNECPKAFSLENPTKYGGDMYPGALSRANDSNYVPPRDFYVTFGTREVFNRCLPIVDEQPELDRQICALPSEC